MEKRIFLKCLRKGSNSYNIVKKLKRCGGEIEKSKLKRVKNLNETIISLYPSIIEGGSKIRLNPLFEYDFVITDIKYASFLHGMCKKYNKGNGGEKAINIPQIVDDGYLIRLRKKRNVS